MALLVGSGTSLGGLTGGAAVARLLVVVSGNTSGLYESLGKATASLEGFRQNAGVLGSALTRSLTLPILALGGIAINMASQFQTAMARVAGLTPVLEESGRSVASVGAELIEMSKRTGTSAVELANALYFAGSAGLRGGLAQALQVVELSARGAAIGMGSAADISKVLIFALNNYADEGLTAAEAMDTLTVAIREGTAEPNELAIALGRLIPIAKEAGVSFAELVGSVAALTNLGVPTRVATTSLRALFSQLLAPTIQAKELLASLGITAEELRDQLALGPVAAFDLLFKATNNNIDALHDIIPQIRAFTAFLGLTGEQAERVQEIYKRTVNSTGALERAFAEIAKTPAFKFQLALQQLSAAAIELGNKAMPIFLAVVQAIQDIGEALESLPGAMQYAVIAFLGLAATIGPVLKMYDALTNAGVGLFTNTRSLITGIAALGLAVGLAGANFVDMITSGTNLLNVMGTLVGTFAAARLALGGLQVLALKGVLGINQLTGSLILASKAGLAFASLGVAAVVAGIAIWLSQGKKLKEEMNELATSATNAASAGQTVRKWLKDISDNEAAASIRKVADAMGLLDKSVGDALPKLTEGISGDFITSLRALERQLRGAFQEVEADKLAKFIPVLERAAEEGIDLGAALKRAGLSSKGFFGLLDDLESHTTAIGHSFKGGSQRSRELALEVGHLQEAWRNFNLDSQANIAVQVANEEAIASLADKYGVSVPFMQEQLNRYTGGVAIMDDKTEEAFGHAAGIVDEKTGDMIGAEAELAAATEAMAEEMATSLRDSFTVFGELPDKFNKPMDKLLSRADQLSDIAKQQASDVRTLFERGVPAGLIEKILDEGPNAARRFADASDKELRRLVTSYQVALGAMDEEILKEAVHQEKKGASMVERFTTSILRRRTLPRDAAEKIVTLMTDAFARGRTDTAGLRTVKNFADAVAASGLPKKAAGKVVLAFARRLLNEDGLPKVGTKAGRAFAAKLAESADISVAAARALMLRVQRGMEEKIPAVAGVAQRTARESGAQFSSSSAYALAYSAGSGLIGQFLAGIIGRREDVTSTVASLADLTASTLNEKLKGSPKYFTYYLGQDLVKQMAQGMDSIGSVIPNKDVSRVLHHPTARIPPHLRDGGRRRDGHSHTARLVDWDTGLIALDNRMDTRVEERLDAYSRNG